MASALTAAARALQDISLAPVRIISHSLDGNIADPPSRQSRSLSRREAIRIDVARADLDPDTSAYA
jgi:hypothetical protein